jgi:hypothetical protein
MKPRLSKNSFGWRCSVDLPPVPSFVGYCLPARAMVYGAATSQDAYNAVDRMVKARNDLIVTLTKRE